MLQLKRIQNSQGQWLEEEQDMAEEVVRFFEAQFHETVVPTQFDILKHVPALITRQQKDDLTAIPTKEEVCWDIMDDVFNMVWDFVRGMELPRYITHTNLVLLPKKKEVVTYSYMKPISLSNFGNKVFSRGVHERLKHLLPNLISQNQAGVKQGDPLSPTLFILATGVLSRSLNFLHENLWFCGFGLPKWSPKINHLAYADDTIIFSSSCEISLGLIMNILTEYEQASGQLINKTKSSVYLHDKVDLQEVQKVERVTGITRQAFPLKYFGCPIYYSKTQVSFYSDLLSKVRNKLQGWKGKLLSFGGRAVLLKHVLQATPMHLLSAVDPPSFVIEKLHKILAQFF
ncbi:uncharacterized protein LOC132066031 [Lycium ferocissimum]|uniref:uncharacterized protein LOC132066031 n=1 Tax=Lycium ferocissimum TaxID=112874 RepID=UPI002815C9D9|nr:uncharacterized protein LOC132066031 [Lycium ferocissimum]